MYRIVKGLFVVVAALLLAATCSSVASADDTAKAKPAPAVEVTPHSLDFGVIDEGTMQKVVFKIKNTGNDELIIFDARPSCGCTVANLSSKKLNPGETSTLEATYNSTNASGPVHKAIYVKTNAPGGDNIALEFTGTVNAKPSPELLLSEYNSTDLKLQPGGSTTRSVKLTNSGQLDLTLDEMSATPGISAKVDTFSAEPGKTVKMGLLMKPGETRVMDVVIAPKAPAGFFQEYVTVRSNAKRRPVSTFVVQGMVAK